MPRGHLWLRVVLGRDDAPTATVGEGLIDTPSEHFRTRLRTPVIANFVGSLASAAEPHWPCLGGVPDLGVENARAEDGHADMVFCQFCSQCFANRGGHLLGRGIESEWPAHRSNRGGAGRDAQVPNAVLRLERGEPSLRRVDRAEHVDAEEPIDRVRLCGADRVGCANSGIDP